MIPIKGKKCCVNLIFFDSNTNNEIILIKNPNPLLIPKISETIDLEIFGTKEINFTGNGDFTVKNISKTYLVSEDKTLTLRIFVELI